MIDLENFLAALEVMLIVIAAYFLARHFHKRKNLDAQDTTKSAIDAYEIVEVTEQMTPFEKWHVTIKNFSRHLRDTKIFDDEARTLWFIAETVERPLQILVMGEFKTGKSTFINALLRGNVLTTDAAPATAVVTLVTYGETKSATIHYRDGTTASYDAEKISEITAEGDDSKATLRDKIDYVELSYPAEVLRNIEIVDTPGLNVHKPSHIDSTENFQSRADFVIWVFDAARIATRSEIEQIDALGQRLKPMAIVNRIDNIDEDEETVDEVLERARKKLSGKVADVIGISAGLAYKAILTGNVDALAESRWQNFLETFQSQIVEKAAPLKLKSIGDKVLDFCAALENSIRRKEEMLSEREKYFANSDAATVTLNQAIANISEALAACDMKVAKIRDVQKTFTEKFEYVAVDSWIDQSVTFLSHEIEAVESLTPYKNFLAQFPNTEKFIREIEMYDCQAAQESIRVDGWLERSKYLDDLRQILDALAAELADAKDERADVGIFDFSGKQTRYNRLVDEYNANVTNFNLKRQEYFEQGLMLMKNLYRICGEVENLARGIRKFLDDTLTNCRRELDNVTKNFEIEREKYLQDCRQVSYGYELLANLRRSVSQSRAK